MKLPAERTKCTSTLLKSPCPRFDLTLILSCTSILFISAAQVITSMSLAEVQVYSAAAASDPEAPLQWLDAGSEGLAPSADDGIRRACLPFSLQV